jgi:chromosomal replication initiation ATPase DnaA
MTPAEQARTAALVARLDEVLAENAMLRARVRQLEAPAAPPSIRRLVSAAAAEWGVPPAALLSAGRQRQLARPRQAVMYLAATRLNHSLPLIGRCLRRDHSTVLYGRYRMADLIEQDPDLAARVERVAAAAIEPRSIAA